MRAITTATATFAELTAIAAVAEHRSFRGAAKALAMSASALSHAIAGVERRLGVRMFHRTTRSVALTEAGARLLGRVRPALRDIADALTEAGARSVQPAGTLRINASAVAASLVVMPLVLELIKKHPAIEVDLVTDEGFIDIVAQGFDAGVRAHDAVPRDMIAVRCSGDVRFAVVAAPRLLKRVGAPLTPPDLRDRPCIRARHTGGAIYRWDFERRGRKLGLDVDGPLTLDTTELMTQAALAGVGFAYITEWMAAPHLATGRLVRVLDDWTPAYRGLALYHPANRHVPGALRAFVDLVRAHRF